MLETIFEWILQAVGTGMDALVSLLMDLLEMDLNVLVGSFPLFSTAYQILQGVAIGLIVAMAAWNMLKFFLGKMGNVQDTPIQILFRTGAAAFLVFFGGHILNLIVVVAKIPYDAIKSLNAVEPVGFFTAIADGDVSTKLLSTVSGVDGISTSVNMLLSLVVIILVAINLFKLYVEVIERYLMVGVLTYTSPVFYPFLTSSGGQQVFTKWCSMYVGQCAMMSISALFFKLIISGFQFTGEEGAPLLLKITMILAMCKIAQRVDNYMQQLGIGVAHTGENLMGDIMSLGAAFSRGGRSGGGGANGESRGGNSRSSVLGSAVGAAGGIVKNAGGAIGAVAQGASALKNGATMKEAAKAAAFGAIPGFYAAKAAKNGISRAFGVKDVGYDSVKAAEAYDKQAQTRQRVQNMGDSGTYTKSYAERAKDANMAASQYASYNARLNGTGKATAPNAEDRKDNRSFSLDKSAVDAGIGVASVPIPPGAGDKIHADPNEPGDAAILTGDASLVSDHIKNNFNQDAAQYQDESGYIHEEAMAGHQAAMQNTVEMDGNIAEQTMFGHDGELKDNDDLSTSALKGMFGQGIVEDGGKLSDVQTSTQDITKGEDGRYHGGGRTMAGTYTDSQGKSQEVKVCDEAAYGQLSKREQAKMKPIQSESGTTYYTNMPTVTAGTRTISAAHPQPTGNVGGPSSARVAPAAQVPQPSERLRSAQGALNIRPDATPATAASRVQEIMNGSEPISGETREAVGTVLEEVGGANIAADIVHEQGITASSDEGTAAAVMGRAFGIDKDTITDIVPNEGTGGYQFKVDGKQAEFISKESYLELSDSQQRQYEPVVDSSGHEYFGKGFSTSRAEPEPAPHGQKSGPTHSGYFGPASDGSSDEASGDGGPSRRGGGRRNGGGSTPPGKRRGR